MAWRLLALALAVGVAACYSPTVEDGLPCGPGNACPTGQNCDVDQRCRIHPVDAGSADPDAPDASEAGIIDAPPDGNPNLDFDFDGVNDSADNCRMIPNTDQRDHDGDLLGDVCDNCPHVSNPFQAAILDADLVGDACDPNQGRLDTQVRFEGFYAAPTGWTLPSGWTVGGGKLTGTIASGFTYAYLDVALASDLTVVSAASMTPGSGTPNVSVIAHLTPATSQYHRCGVVSGNPGRAEITVNTGAGFTTIDQINYTTGTYADIAMTMDLTGANITCAARAGLQTLNLAGPDSGSPGQRVGLRVREATGVFDYVVVYSH